MAPHKKRDGCNSWQRSSLPARTGTGLVLSDSRVFAIAIAGSSSWCCIEPEILAAAADIIAAAADMGSAGEIWLVGSSCLLRAIRVGKSVVTSIESGMRERRGNHSLRVDTGTRPGGAEEG